MVISSNQTAIRGRTEGVLMGGDYGRLCETTADELFGPDKAGQPVYTLAEPEALVRIATAAELEGDPMAAYCSTVRDTLHLDDHGIPPLRWHVQASERHLRRPLDTPPSLPLLVVLTWAAESMQAGTDIASTNYYKRLFPLLAVPDERQSRLTTDYQHAAETLWGSLNAWLESWEGERGVPTAYALGGMRLIGLPMSQAVVRRHDREGLHHVFDAEGLPPGFRMGAPDMELALDPYASRQPSPLSGNLRRLWTVPAARERIVQAACLELEAWTGAGSERPTGSRVASATRVLAYLRTFPRKVIELNLAIPAMTSDADTAVFASPEGHIAVPTTSGPTGTVRLASTDALSGDSLLGDLLGGTLGVDGPAFERRPRRVVPLRWDELQGCYVEVERVGLGEDNLVLAMADAKVRVEKLLSACARPGWELLEAIPGLPEGWLVFRQVQIVRAPEGTTHVELIPLVPRARTSLTLQGGFALPGRLRKWSALAPPEVVALAAGASSVTVRVFTGSRLAAEDECLHVTTDGELGIVSLDEFGLDDGEYTVALYVDETRKPASTATLRLRSANTPLFNVEEVDLQLVYSPDSGPTWVMSAGPPSWADYVNGARIVGAVQGNPPAVQMHEFRPRKKHTSAPVRRQTRLGAALPPDSCMATGKHRFQLPTAEAGRPRSRSIEGECQTCGLVRRFAATPWAAKKRTADPHKAAPAIAIPAVVEHGETDQHVAFDALSHVGHGSYGVFERIAGQIEGSGLFADTFLRRQEVTGHIDVRRDDFLQPVEWAVNAATLVPVPDGTWVLIGARSPHLVEQVRELLDQNGHVRGSTDAGILRLVVDSDPDIMKGLADDLAAIGVALLDHSPAREIATELPSLGEVEHGLKRVPVPAFQSLEIWDTASATWVPGTSLASTGAFRLRDFRSIYALRSRDDLDRGTVAIGTAQLVKHIANRWAGDPLIGYHTRSGSVVVPLGADLPGLYGRALSLCSGRAPRELPESRMVQYPDVPRDVADIVADRLMR